MTEPRENSLNEERAIELAKVIAPLAVVAIAIIVGVIQGIASGILVLAGGALVATITIFWGSVRALIGESDLTAADAYAVSAPRAEEEQKRAVLRALKDLEFERSVGKISEEDFRELTQKYRAQAKRLIQQLDADKAPQREKALELLEARLARRVARDPEATEQRSEVVASQGEASPLLACAQCGTMNDPDAVYCKKCGNKRAGDATPSANEEASS